MLPWLKTVTIPSQHRSKFGLNYHHFDVFAQQARASIRYYFRLQQASARCFITYLRSIYFSLLVSASRLGTSRAAAVLRHRAQNKMPNCNSILICEIRQEKTLSYVTFEKEGTCHFDFDALHVILFLSFINNDILDRR